MEDDSKLKIVIFVGAGLFCAASIGIFLVVLRMLLIFYPDIAVMGIGMSTMTQ